MKSLLKALGYLGQYIYVVPKSDLVVVFTSGDENTQTSYIAPVLMEQFILPAVKSDKPLAPNKAIARKMVKLLRKIENRAMNKSQ